MVEEPRGPAVRERDPEGASSEQPGSSVVRERPVEEHQEATAPGRETEGEAHRRPVEPPPMQTRTSALAIASLATGIAAWFLFPIAGAIAAVITGYFALQEINQGHGWVTGNAFATAGIVLGGVQLGLVLLGGILVAIIASSAGPGVTTSISGHLPNLIFLR